MKAGQVALVPSPQTSPRSARRKHSPTTKHSSRVRLCTLAAAPLCDPILPRAQLLGLRSEGTERASRTSHGRHWRTRLRASTDGRAQSAAGSERRRLPFDLSRVPRGLAVTGPPSSLRARDESVSALLAACACCALRCVALRATGGRHLWRGRGRLWVTTARTHAHTQGQSRAECSRLWGDLDAGKRRARGGNSPRWYFSIGSFAAASGETN